MATEYKKIILRRGTGTPPTDLSEGELAYETNTDILYVGNGSASPNHYKQVASRVIVGTAKQDSVTFSSDPQTQLDAKQATLTGGATTIASADLTASRALTSNASGKVAVSAVTDTELGFLSGVTSAIQTQINSINTNNEWTLVSEFDQNASTSMIIGSSNSATHSITYDFANYDYKFVVNSSTDEYDSTSQLLIQFNEDANAGKHASVKNVITMAADGSVSNAAGGEYGATSTNIATGLVLGSGGQPGTLPATTATTMLAAEFVINRSLVASNSLYVYLLQGNGSIVNGESGTNTNLATQFSISKISQFTGSFGSAGATLDSVKLTGLLSAGSTDAVKVRVYRRGR